MKNKKIKPLATVNKDDPKSWKKYDSKNCKSCLAHCCSMPIEIRWEDLVRLKLLSEKDLAKSLTSIVKKLKKENTITAYRKETGLFALKQTPAGDCPYLDAKRRCSVYKIRPLVCRKFPEEMGWRHGYCPQEPKEASAKKTT